MSRVIRAAGRRAKEREAIHLADDGAAPPLYVRGPAYPWGALHATEELGPGAALAAWKASAVVGMLERRVGEDTFKRLLERHVVASCAADAPPGATPGSVFRIAVCGTTLKPCPLCRSQRFHIMQCPLLPEDTCSTGFHITHPRAAALVQSWSAW